MKTSATRTGARRAAKSPALHPPPPLTPPPAARRISPRLLAGTRPDVAPAPADAPLLVFINGRSGGKAGAALAAALRRALGAAQVFDVSRHRPADVLAALAANLKAAVAAGDAEAAHAARGLRLVAAGGDGTVVWVLAAAAAAGLDPPPPVGVIPLGTGNDLARVLGWGKGFRAGAFRSDAALRATLARFAAARPARLDAWRLELAAPDARLLAGGPHQLERLGGPAAPRAGARFWNYLSVGMDAAAAAGFHAMREAHPRLAAGRIVNQAWYAAAACGTGWFCGGGARLEPTLTLRVRDAPGGAWRAVAVPKSVRALVVLSLSSYAGGRDLVGARAARGLGADGFAPPAPDDGLLEVVGLRSAWHTSAIMLAVSPRVHALRLAQAAAVELELVGGRGETFMQLDGEPWRQRIPRAGAPLLVRVENDGQSAVLMAPGRMRRGS